MPEMLAISLLTPAETTSLHRCEQVIERGLKTFVEVGEALMEIRDSRLYRQTHQTFEAYCSERWGMARNHAYRFIDAAETVGAMSPIGDKPATESQVRPLTPLKENPPLVVAAWEDAQELAKEEGLSAPVARHVEAAVAPYREALKEAKQEAQEATETPSIFAPGGSRHFAYPKDEEIVEQVRAQKPVHVSQNSGENEWYTPSEYIEAARRVMGQIDLDPASCEVANQTVKASQFFSKDDSGLERLWKAKALWMNPPYAADLVRQFAQRFAQYVSCGHVEEGIVLVNNATETRWFLEMVTVCTAVVFPTGRVRFLSPQGAMGAPLQGQAILYAGSRPDAFLREFCAFGWGMYTDAIAEKGADNDEL